MCGFSFCRGLVGFEFCGGASSPERNSSELKTEQPESSRNKKTTNN